MEFGSDYHTIEYPVGSGLPYRIFSHYVSGRQPLLDVIRTTGYRRIWIPCYYCGESLKILDRSAVEICRYACLPSSDIHKSVERLPLAPDDLLLLVNYFGLHGFNDARLYPCDVIEDHTHDLIGEWAKNSTARWCFASVRKTLPTADGGILWSPRNESLPQQPGMTAEVEEIVSCRYKAMGAKAEYLKNHSADKDAFLHDFRETEERFGSFGISDCLTSTNGIIHSIDLTAWYGKKKANYTKLLSLLSLRHSKALMGSSINYTPFSLILLFNNNELRDNARNFLIHNKVYPAILWPDVYERDENAVDFSKRMLSIHCDGRYDESDMTILAEILNRVI